MKKQILILNGPNLNLMEQREAGLYGNQSLEDICWEIRLKSEELDLECLFFQSNSEGALIDQIQRLTNEFDGCILNAGAYAHYSYAIRDALACVHKPKIEVHMTNVYAREDFRHTSVLAGVCDGQIAGFGKTSYILALYAIKELIET